MLKLLRNEVMALHNYPSVAKCAGRFGCSGEKFAAAIKQILGCGFEVVKKSDLHSFKVMPMACRTHFCLA